MEGFSYKIAGNLPMGLYILLAGSDFDANTLFKPYPIA